MLTGCAVLCLILTGVIPVEVLLFGGLMLVILVLMHGAGLDWIVGRHRRRCDLLLARGWHPQLATWIFAVTILLMLALHLN